ncbi:hypothetical protein Q5692_13065 [Microcoleus sp. C2C3]|uniref:hypothetical protein n=1 Tax=unclassified Microcoleus TaxID=2642155 RepID=UPI002FD35284
MIISDLNHVEVVSEETETRIVGGVVVTSFSYKVSSYAPPAPFLGPNGKVTSTSTLTTIITIGLGFGSSSSSSSSTTRFY